MADEFERWLQESLAPPERDPDHEFAARVRTLAALDDRYRAAWRVTAGRVALEAIALGATTLSAVAIARLPQLAGMIDDAPEIAVTALLGGFALMVLVMGREVPQYRAKELTRP